MAMGCVCWPSGWNAGALYGPKPTMARSRSPGRNSLCCWKGSTGADRNGRRLRRWQVNDKLFFIEIFTEPPRGLRYVLVRMANTAAPHKPLPDLDHLSSEDLKAIILAQQEK